MRFWAIMHRLGLRAAACGSAAIALALAQSAPAAATPSVDEATRYVRGELARLCNNDDAARFEELGDGAKLSACYVQLGAGRLSLDVRFRNLSKGGTVEVARGAAGELRKRVQFGLESYFYCASFKDDGFASLYISCHFESSATENACAQRSIRLLNRRRSESSVGFERSFARLITLPARRCETLKNALNYIGARSRYSSDRSVEDFFGEVYGRRD